MHSIKLFLYSALTRDIGIVYAVACLAVAQWAEECSGLTESQAKSLNEPCKGEYDNCWLHPVKTILTRRLLEEPPASPDSNTSETLVEGPEDDR